MTSVNVELALKPARIRYLVVIVWLVFTLSLLAWWVYFASSQLERLMELDHGSSSELIRYQRMLLWEGATLFLCLFGGAAGLVYFTFRELAQAKRIREFFLAFTHDIRTPLASVRLQAELLGEALEDSPQLELAKKLIKETSRLELQLENSLFLAASDTQLDASRGQQLSELISSLQESWTNLQWQVQGEALLQADPRALRCIFSNIAQNAIKHGHAQTLTISAKQSSHKINKKHPYVALSFTNDGKGFEGDITKIGKAFSLQSKSSGTGLGLYLVKKLTSQMHGEATYALEGKRIIITLVLPGTTTQQV